MMVVKDDLEMLVDAVKAKEMKASYTALKNVIGIVHIASILVGKIVPEANGAHV